MEGLIFIIFENLDIAALSYEEGMDCLYYIDFLLEKEESPESFIKYQFIKNKIEGRLKELKKNTATIPHP